MELPGKGFKNYKERKQEKQERHESNCPDRPSRKRTDSCQPLEIFGPLPTSKLEHILIYKNDSLGPPWADSCPQANCLGATPIGSARGALDDALLQPESFWGSELLFGVPGKHTQRLTPTKHHIYVRRWTNSQKDAGLLQYQIFIVSVRKKRRERFRHASLKVQFLRRRTIGPLDATGYPSQGGAPLACCCVRRRKSLTVRKPKD